MSSPVPRWIERLVARKANRRRGVGMLRSDAEVAQYMKRETRREIVRRAQAEAGE